MSQKYFPAQPDFGALVFSIDFELHWGVRDLQRPNGSYRQNLLGERVAVPEMLRVFREFGIAGTWATVGFLFAQTRDELQQYSPVLKPQYDDASLSPYEEELGTDEAADPLHYAPSLIKQIQQTPQQEIGTHTFSHYYCLEGGQTQSAFEADLVSAKAIAKNYGVQLSSIVFPRNQVNQQYLSTLLEHDIFCYRGNEQSWMYQAVIGGTHPSHMRAGRIADTYINLSGQNLTSWGDAVQPSGICNIPSSRFIRPCSAALPQLEALRLRRIVNAMREAARAKKIIHLWTHAHNLGVDLPRNIAFLRAICTAFQTLQKQYGMRALTMSEAALLAKGAA